MPFNLWSDLRYAARSLSRSPGFAVAAIVTIALGVGVNAGVFTVLNGVLFRDSAGAGRARARVDPADGRGRAGLPAQRVWHVLDRRIPRLSRPRADALRGAGARPTARETTLGGDSPQEIFGTLVTCNYFDVLRQPPALGRALAAQDCEPGADPVVVLGHELWSTTFAADPAIVGRTVELNRQSFTVVGVASEGTDGGPP